MLGWLGRKNQDARVFMCIKEIKMTLDAAAPVGRAKILAMAQLLRTSIFHAGKNGEIDQPFNFRPDELMDVYSGLETARNNSTVQLEALKKNGKNLGMPVPAYAIEHVHTTTRGLEVWMCTVGAGIVPNRRDDVRSIWTMLSDAYRNVPEAIANLREIEQLTTGGCGDMFALHDDEWTDLCKFVPSAFGHVGRA